MVSVSQGTNYLWQLPLSILVVFSVCHSDDMQNYLHNNPYSFIVYLKYVKHRHMLQ